MLLLFPIQTKPITIRQANLQAMLTGSRSPSPEPDANRPLTHTEEQEALRRETIAAFHGAVADDNAEGDDFLIPREKTQDEREKEEEEYRVFLEREVGDLRDLVSVDGHSDEEERQDKEETKENEKEEGADGKKKKKKKKSKKDAGAPENGIEKKKKSKAEEDQEFLLKLVVCLLFFPLILLINVIF